MATDDKYLLLKTHPCSYGLSSKALREIADTAELVRCEPGQFVHHAREQVKSVFLIIHGRLKLTALDGNDNVILQRFHTTGGQFGGLAAALTEPSQVDCVAEDPTTLLRLDYQAGLELTRKYGVFRRNMTQILADSLKQTLLSNRRPNPKKLVALFHQSNETRNLSRALLTRLSELGESVCVLSDLPNWKPIDGVEHRCCYQSGMVVPEEEIRDQVNQSLSKGRVVVDVINSIDTDHASNVLEICGQILWCVTPGTWKASVERLILLQQRAPNWRDKVTVVWLLEDEDCAPLAHELRKLAARDIKVSFQEPAPKQGRALRLGFERLVHLLRDVKIGVALGGGAARGMAHLGVLKALERHGIAIDMIAGTSAGAMTGTLFTSGMEVDYSIDCFSNDLRPSWFFRTIPRGEQLYLLYKYRRGQFDPMLRKYLLNRQLQQLPITMRTITVDLIDGEAVIRESGDAVHAITESINVPGLATPINRDGRALIDGGLIKNIPADVLVENGCNFVIAVSVTAKMEKEFARNRSDTPTSQMKSASTIQTLLRSYVVQSRSINAFGVQPADYVIEPDVTAFDLTEFRRTDELAKIGEMATLEAMPKIKKLLAGLDEQLFRRPE